MQKRVELYKPTVGVGLMFAYLIAVLSLILGILSLGLFLTRDQRDFRNFNDYGNCTKLVKAPLFGFNDI